MINANGIFVLNCSLFVNKYVIEMENIILNVFFENDLNINIVGHMAENLAVPLPLLRIENRPRKVRNENYFENIVPEYSDVQFFEHFRMSRETAEALTNIIAHHLDNPNELAPLNKKVLFSVWVLSKQESFLATSDRFGFPPSTGHNIFRKIIITLSNLLPQFVVWPDINSYDTIAVNFEHQTQGFPGIIGAIDGCHIECKQPINNAVDYYNRKGTHSIILQGTCDFSGKFIDVYIGSPGRMHDSRVFRNSPLFQNITAADPLIPPEFHLLGDAAYPLMKNVMTPFRNIGQLTAAQTMYNRKFNSGRAIIERAFGLLKAKFRRLRYLDIKDFELGNHMIAAACVLHNFILEHHNEEAENDVNEQNFVPHAVNEGGIFDLEAVEKRNHIVAILQ